MKSNTVSVSTQTHHDGYVNRISTVAMEKLYLDNDSADVYFIFGDGSNDERIPAHKAILSATNDAFRAMFYGDLRESGDIKIEDASADAFKEFLQFFYRGTVKLTMDHIQDVAYLVKKYLIPQCLRICEQFLLDSMKIDNVCFSYGLASRFDLSDLTEKCDELFTQQTDAVFQTVGFLECDKSILDHILKLQMLSCSELQVFIASMAWVKAASGQQKVSKPIIMKHLGKSFLDIRFGAMTIEQFSTLLSTHPDLFTIDEYQEIVQMIANNDYNSPTFQREPRQIKWNRNKMILCSRTQNNSQTTSYNFNMIETTTFSASHAILLGEIACAKICVPSNDKRQPIEMLIIENAVENQIPRILRHQHVMLQNGSGQIITLEKPLLVKPHLFYEIQFKPHSIGSSFAGRSLGSSSVLPDTNIAVHFKNFGTTRSSPIDALHFNVISSEA